MKKKRFIMLAAVLAAAVYCAVLRVIVHDGYPIDNVAYRGNDLCCPIHDGEQFLEALREMMP